MCEQGVSEVLCGTNPQFGQTSPARGPKILFIREEEEEEEVEKKKVSKLVMPVRQFTIIIPLSLLPKPQNFGL